MSTPVPSPTRLVALFQICETGLFLCELVLTVHDDFISCLSEAYRQSLECFQALRLN